MRTSRFDRRLTYAIEGDAPLAVGEIVRVPLGTRSVYGYVVGGARELREGERRLRALERTPAPRAFNEEGLALAEFLTQRYLCTLGEALTAITFAGAVPRAVDRLYRARQQPHPERYRSVPERLLRLIWEELGDGWTPMRLLRHPEARRIGDAPRLLEYLQTLQRSGDLVRRRTFGHQSVRARTERWLLPGGADPRGPKARALQTLVAERGELRRSDALLAGFSADVVARAVEAGSIVEEVREARRAPARAAAARSALEPTPEQASAIAAILEGVRGIGGEYLLYGVTGSGKTLVYLEAIAETIARGRRAIVLVPEISLTPQTAARFEERFGARVAVFHSALSDRERFEAWQACWRGDVDVVVGARSAIFAPLENVGLIAIDEEHENSYKQDTAPRYVTADVARERARRTGAVVLFGSATPSLERWHEARGGRSTLLSLPSRATGLPLPAMRVVDMAEELRSGNRRIFSTALLEALERRLQSGEKSVLFVNRRGSAGFLLCRECGWVPECSRCSISLALHRADGVLRCHYCDLQTRAPAQCGHCASGAFREFGVGTQRVEEEMRRIFPRATVLRMDSDTTTRVGDHARILRAFEQDGDVLIGTQMIAKGLDYPLVTLVGVVAADIGLHRQDFRASERTFSLLVQVAGRSGRAQPGEVIVQTYAPRHPAIVLAAAQDYGSFAELELAEREALRYPPFGALLYLGVLGRNRAHVEHTARRYAERIRRAEIAEVLGPAPYPVERVNEEWRWRIACKTERPRELCALIRERILSFARTDRGARIVVNVDP
ncbi:MAG: primosomal protein N' [bacterium]|nr:primosomal protein N' [bacterium]